MITVFVLTGIYFSLSPPHSSNNSFLDGMAYDGVRNRKSSFAESAASSSGGIPTYSGGASTYYRTDSNPLSPWDIQRMEQESGQGQMMQLIPDQDYLQQRANAMEQVESNIVELGTIFNRLAVMVNEHKDMVQRVEDNVDETESMITMSLATLTDTLTNLQTNRALAFKVFSILVVFIIAFIIFLA
jgi:syntaxin 5